MYIWAVYIFLVVVLKCIHMFVLNRCWWRLLEKEDNLGTSEGSWSRGCNFWKVCRFCSSGSATGMGQYIYFSMPWVVKVHHCAGFLCTNNFVMGTISGLRLKLKLENRQACAYSTGSRRG